MLLVQAPCWELNHGELHEWTIHNKTHKDDDAFPFPHLLQLLNKRWRSAAMPHPNWQFPCKRIFRATPLVYIQKR